MKLHFFAVFFLSVQSVSINSMTSSASVSLLQEDSIAFDDFMNDQSSLSRQFEYEKSCAAITLFYNQGVVDDEKSTVTITGVPSQICGDFVDISLSMELNDDNLTILLHDSEQSFILKGYINPRSAILAELVTQPQFSQDRKAEAIRSISGTTALAIWDRLCILCKTKQSEVIDEASYDGFKLRILLPYVRGCSWYGTHGYKPNRIDFILYTRAIEKLRNYPCSMVIADFGPCSEVASCILEACKKCTLDVEITSFGSLIQELFVRWRASKKQQEKQPLWILYTHCMCVYKPSTISANSIDILMWQQVRDYNKVCVKQYRMDEFD